MLLKKIKNRLFPDIKLKIKKIFMPGKIKFFKNNPFNPKKTFYGQNSEIFSFKSVQQKKILTIDTQIKNQKLLKKTVLYIKLLDNYGCFNEI